MLAKRVVITDTCAYHYRQREDSMLKKVASFAADAKKLKYLYDYMFKFALGQDAKYHLPEQVDDFVLGICMMRSGSLSSFGNEIQVKKVAIYSAGTFGQQLYNKLHQSSLCTLVNWVDDDYWEYRRCCMDVDPIEQICKVEYDAIVIALIDPVQIEKIKHLLYDYGVEEKMIITVSSSQEQRDKALKLYLQEAHEISEGLHS
jgi:hypothetical protein